MQSNLYGEILPEKKYGRKSNCVICGSICPKLYWITCSKDCYINYREGILNPKNKIKDMSNQTQEEMRIPRDLKNPLKANVTFYARKEINSGGKSFNLLKFRDTITGKWLTTSSKIVESEAADKDLISLIKAANPNGVNIEFYNVETKNGMGISLRVL